MAENSDVRTAEGRARRGARSASTLKRAAQGAWTAFKKTLPGVMPSSSRRTGFPALLPVERVSPIEPDELARTMDRLVEPILSATRQHDWTDVGVVGKRLRGELGEDSSGRSVSAEERVDPNARGIHSVFYDYSRFREQALIRSVTPLGIPTGAPGSIAADYELREDAHHPLLRERAKGTVLISHGYTGSWQKFDEAAWYFLRAGFNVLIIEHRGHGGSLRETTNPNLVRMREWHNYVTDFLAALRHGGRRFGFRRPLLLFGHSMGGGIAAALLEEHPSLFDRAILSSPMLMPHLPMPLWAARSVAAAMTAAGRGGEPVPGMDDYEAYTAKILEHKRRTGRYEEGTNAALDARTGWYVLRRTPDLRRHTIRPSWDWLNAAFQMDEAVLKKSAIARLSTPTILFNGGLDRLVRSDAEGLFVTRARRANAPLRFYHFPAGHHELFSDMPAVASLYYTTIISFFLSAAGER